MLYYTIASVGGFFIGIMLGLYRNAELYNYTDNIILSTIVEYEVYS